MIRLIVFPMLLLFFSSLQAQEIKVDYDKNRDFSKYKTFRFGEGEIITPKDQRQTSDEEIKKWVTTAITYELESKGLHRVDSAADLIVSYAVGTLARSDMGDVGPMGLTPGSMDRTYMRDYRQGSFIIDLNDRNNFRVWRVNSTSDMTGPSGDRIVEQVVQKGFKKYPKPAKEKKKK